MSSIRVMLVDDQKIITAGLKMILDMEEDIRVIAEAQNGQDAAQLCKWECPDVILMDIKMPVMNGVEAVKIIKNDFPDVKIIMLTTFNDREFIFDAIKNGASGYILKETTPEEIVDIVRKVYSGGVIIEPQAAAQIVEEFSKMASEKKEFKLDENIGKLSEREIEILKLIGNGKSNREISKELYISEGTVRNHITNILLKLDLRDRTQLAIYAIRNNIALL
jgi:DNA-binding NarL/FixJ family response regulator